MQQPDSRRPAIAKPSLLGEPEKNQIETQRILDDGHKSPTAPRVHARKWIVVPTVTAIALMAGGAAWFFGDYQDGATVNNEKTAIDKRGPARDVEKEKNSVQSPVPAVAALEVPKTATIVNEQESGSKKVLPEADAGMTGTEGKLAHALEAGVRPPPAALEKALESAQPTSPAVNVPTTKGIAANAPASNASMTSASKDQVASQAKHRADSEKAQPAHVHQKSVKPDASVGKKPDEDVALLSALVAHTKQQEQGSTVKNAASAKSKPATKVASTSAQKPSNEGSTRKPVESTESQLKHCSTLSILESEQCRWHVCGGRWNTDAACKVR